jgi:glycosyltransferase involved in cell wall biosynthesis
MTQPIANPSPTVSVIIPSADGFRDGCVPKLLESVEAQDYTDYEIHMIEGVSPQGRAINLGADKALGSVLIILDDDSRLADSTVFSCLMNTLASDPKIGMAGASIVTPPESSGFQRKAALQFPRFNTPVVKETTDSDLACHGCCAIPVAVFNEIGREREDIVRGLDPDLRVRLRNAGYRVVLAPNARIYHPLPDGWKRLVRIFFRNGKGSAYALRFQPETVYETHESLHEKDFTPRTSLAYRIARYPFRLLKALATGQFMRLVAYIAYAFGYMWGWLTNREMKPASNAPAPESNGR